MSLLDFWTDKDSDEMEQIEKEEEQRLEERVNRDFSKGSGKLFSDEKIYNKWLMYHGDVDRKTAKDMTDFFEIHEMEKAMYEVYCTSQVFDIDFEDAVIISDPVYVKYEQEGSKKIDRWNLAKKVIENAFLTTPSKLQEAVDTLLTLDSDIPTELEKAIMIRSNYNKNQKAKALQDALSGIFPTLNHKPTIELIARKALK